MLPDRSVLIGQKLVENAKIKNYKCDILSNFQTMCEKVMCKMEQFLKSIFSTRKSGEESFWTIWVDRAKLALPLKGKMVTEEFSSHMIGCKRKQSEQCWFLKVGKNVALIDLICANAPL